MSVIRKHIVLFGSLAVFVATFAIYCLILHFFDITLLGTANGAYKAVHFHEWLHGKGEIETANALYYPMLKLISMVFQLKTPFQIYYGIVLLNGFFSSVLLAFLFHYFSVYLKNMQYALMIVFVHFVLGGYFILSTNNEDIFPAYTFFVIGILFFNNFIRTNELRQLVYSIVALSLAALIHWTIGLPTCAALVLFFIFSKGCSWPEKLKYLLISGVVSLFLFVIVSLTVHIPLLELIYPAKETNSLWVSDFEFKKLALGLLNIPFFFFLGNTVRNFDHINKAMLISTLIPVLIGFFISIRFFRFRKQDDFKQVWQSEKHFFRLLLLISVIGFSMNIYEQGSDHQFLIQPCFIFIYAFVFILRLKTRFRTGIWGIRLLLLFLLAFFTSKLIVTRTTDTQYFQQFEIVKANVTDFKKTLFIGIPFRTFHIVAQLKLEKPSDYHSLSLPSEDQSDFLLSDAAYEEKYIRLIKEYEAKGFQVVLINLLNKSPDKVGNIFIGYDMSDKIGRMKNYFLRNYVLEKKCIFKEVKSTFYFIEPRSTHQSVSKKPRNVPTTIYKL